jgi:hypothetical protein
LRDFKGFQKVWSNEHHCALTLTARPSAGPPPAAWRCQAMRACRLFPSPILADP